MSEHDKTPQTGWRFREPRFAPFEAAAVLDREMPPVNADSYVEARQDGDPVPDWHGRAGRGMVVAHLEQYLRLQCPRLVYAGRGRQLRTFLSLRGCEFFELFQDRWVSCYQLLHFFVGS